MVKVVLLRDIENAQKGISISIICITSAGVKDKSRLSFGSCYPDKVFNEAYFGSSYLVTFYQLGGSILYVAGR
jgi:hypothetical protein